MVQIKYSYNWFWCVLSVLWIGGEWYWAGCAIDRCLPSPIPFGMMGLSAGIGLGFLLAFVKSQHIVQLRQQTLQGE